MTIKGAHHKLARLRAYFSGASRRAAVPTRLRPWLSHRGFTQPPRTSALVHCIQRDGPLERCPRRMHRDGSSARGIVRPSVMLWARVLDRPVRLAPSSTTSVTPPPSVSAAIGLVNRFFVEPHAVRSTRRRAGPSERLTEDQARKTTRVILRAWRR